MMLLHMYEVYEAVINILKRKNDDDKIAKAVKTILNTYSNEGLTEHADGIDFDVHSFRCAYVYLYATSHVHLVYSSLACFCEESNWEFMNWVNCNGQKNLLAIGGGPGTDMVGLLLFLQPILHWASNVNCKVVDAYMGWEEVLDKTLIVLNTRKYFRSLNVGYHKENLLQPLTNEMRKMLQEANFVTMSKFVSAITADNATAMRLRIMFRQLQLGTLVYFVDNAGGDAFRLGERVAATTGLVPVWGPIYHHQFRIEKNCEPMDEVLACPRFGGIRPQTSTKVSIVIWKKVACPPRGLKRTLTADGPLNYNPETGNRNRPRVVAKRRLGPQVRRTRSKTAPWEGQSKRINHRRATSEIPLLIGPPGLRNVVQLDPKRGALSPYNLRNIPDAYKTPTSKQSKKEVFPQSPYSYTDLSFNVPITPMVRQQEEPTRMVDFGLNENSPVLKQRGQGTPYQLRKLRLPYKTNSLQ